MSDHTSEKHMNDPLAEAIQALQPLAREAAKPGAPDRVLQDFARRFMELPTDPATRAYGYLSRLFKSCAPQCEPFDDLIGLCTQIDNLIAGYRIRLGEIPDPAASRGEQDQGEGR